MIDVYDSEIQKIGYVTAVLRERADGKRLNYLDFEREIKDRFAEIGFTVSVTWNRYAVGGQVQEDSAMPTIDITGRIDPSEVFDKDRMVWEVTQNILELPGQEKGEVIRTDQGEAFKRYRE